MLGELVLGFVFVLCCGLVVVLVGFAVGGVRCWVAVGGVDYGGWLGFLFNPCGGKNWGEGETFCVFFSSFWRKYSE